MRDCLSFADMAKQMLFATIISTISVGCTINEPEQAQQEDLHEVVFHAGWESETKTVLQEDGTSIWWSPGDEIALFTGWNGSKYKLISDCNEPSPKTNFIGSIGEGEGPFYAIYPYPQFRKLPKFFDDLS